MKIVTGYAGEAHITSNDDQGLLQGIFGNGNYILPVRGRFAATLVSSNELQISDGEGVLQGVHFRTEPGTTDSVTIENGTQGMQRIDLICARYQKDAETGIETMTWINHKGTPAASNPATPPITSGDLLAGDTLAEFPVYSVRLNGITVQSVTLLATIISPASLIGNTSITGIGDGTLTGAISALNASLSDHYKTATITLPTSGSGNIYYSFGKKVYVLAAWATRSDTFVCPYPVSGTGADGATTWWFNVRAATAAGAAVANTSVTVHALYIDA